METVKSVLPLCVLVACVAGCGDGRPSLVSATGTVTIDGKPVEGATVMFQPVEVDASGFARPAIATTDASGTFSMGTYGTGDGVPAGKYNVGIEKRELVGQLPANYNPEMPAATNVRYKVIVPSAYADPASSGLTAEVTSGGIEPPVFALESGGTGPQIEVTGPQRRANEP